MYRVTDNNGWTVADRFSSRAAAIAWARRCDGPLWIEEYDSDGEWIVLQKVL